MIDLTPNSANIAALPDHSKEHYVAMKQLPDGRICGVCMNLYNYSLQVDVSEWGYEDKFCYTNLKRALTALQEWDGAGDPADGWVRHLKTMRRRDLKTGEEWIAP